MAILFVLILTLEFSLVTGKVKNKEMDIFRLYTRNSVGNSISSNNQLRPICEKNYHSQIECVILCTDERKCKSFIYKLPMCKIYTSIVDTRESFNYYGFTLHVKVSGKDHYFAYRKHGGLNVHLETNKGSKGRCFCPFKVANNLGVEACIKSLSLTAFNYRFHNKRCVMRTRIREKGFNRVRFEIVKSNQIPKLYCMKFHVRRPRRRHIYMNIKNTGPKHGGITFTKVSYCKKAAKIYFEPCLN